MRRRRGWSDIDCPDKIAIKHRVPDSKVLRGGFHRSSHKVALRHPVAPECAARIRAQYHQHGNRWWEYPEKVFIAACASTRTNPGEETSDMRLDANKPCSSPVPSCPTDLLRPFRDPSPVPKTISRAANPAHVSFWFRRQSDDATKYMESSVPA